MEKLRFSVVSGLLLQKKMSANGQILFHFRTTWQTPFGGIAAGRLLP